jgi:L-rhamnose mutarotase
MNEAAIVSLIASYTESHLNGRRLTVRNGGCINAILSTGKLHTKPRCGGSMPRHCLALDLKDDAEAIAEYKRYHVKIWPEVRDSLREAGVMEMEIYLMGTRLFMIMDVNETFSLSAKAAADAANAKVQEWEAIMGQFQQPLPQSRPGQRWVVMERVFSLADQ